MRFVLAIISFVVAAVMIGAGIAQRTIFLEPDEVALSASSSTGAAVTVVDGEALNAFSGSQTLTISGSGDIVAAYGRSTDVIAWLGDTTWTILVVSVVQSWKWMGLSMLIYLAGLKSIPDDVLEAAKIDGAGWWRTLRSVRFPLLAPAVTFNVATALLGSMNGFDTVQATTKGGPAGTTEVLNIFIYRTFGQGLYAQATTMSLILFLVVILLAFPVIWALRRREKQLL